MSQLEFKQDKVSHFSVMLKDDICVGKIFPAEDGYYQFFPNRYTVSFGGYWPSYMLREIANKVDELNKDRDEELKVNLAKLNK